MSSFYFNRQVVVTGGGGFLASHLIEALVEQGAIVRAIGRSPKPDKFPNSHASYVQANLLDRKACEHALQGAEFVFHLAAVGWGFHENLKRQPQLLTDNLLLNTTVLDVAYCIGVERYLYTSSSAVYPGHLQELNEDTSWDRPPHPGELCFGWAKRMGEIQAKAYHKHYGLPIAIVRPANPYGPRDNFDPHNSHVIPALIRRAVARENPFVVWGTGKAVRSFVHARDVSRAMMLALIRCAECEPINIASNKTTTIGELVKLVLEISGHTTATIKFENDKPDGHPRKVPNVQRAATRLGITEYIPLSEGIKETIEWYVNKNRGEM